MSLSKVFDENDTSKLTNLQKYKKQQEHLFPLLPSDYQLTVTDDLT